MPENWSWRTRQLLTCRCQRDVAALDAKYTKELAEQAGKWCLRDDVAAGRRRLQYQSARQSVREATTASGVDNAASPDCRHRWTGLFSPQREADHYKTTGRNPEVILMSSADRAVSIDGTTIIVSNNNALPAEYKCLK